MYRPLEEKFLFNFFEMEIHTEKHLHRNEVLCCGGLRSPAQE
jgi:hypothetical protein